MGKKLNSCQQCASDVAGDVAGDKLLATGVHFCFGPCTYIKKFLSEKKKTIWLMAQSPLEVG